MNLIMQTTIDLRSLSSPALFAKTFDVSEEVLMAVCDGDRNLFQNKRLAERDSMAIEFMTAEEQTLFLCGSVAEDTGNLKALEEYRKKKVYFGVIETLLGSWCGADPLFERMTAFRTWSRWEKILFLSPVSDLDNILDGDCSVKQEVKERFSSTSNFDPLDDHKKEWVRFLLYYLDVLTFRDAFRAMMPAWQIGKYRSYVQIFVIIAMIVVTHQTLHTTIKYQVFFSASLMDFS